MFEFETVLYFVSVDCSRLIERKSNPDHASLQPTRSPTKNRHPPQQAGLRPNHCNAITLNTLRQRLVRHTRSKNIPHRRAPARTSKPGWREKHQYQQQQIYLISCLLWTRVTSSAKECAFSLCMSVFLSQRHHLQFA